MLHIKVESQEELIQLLADATVIEFVAFQNVNFRPAYHIIFEREYSNCIFLGCTLPEDFIAQKLHNCLIFPSIDVPYNTFIPTLYTREMLYDAFVPGEPDTFASTLDQQIYHHYLSTGKEAFNIKETLARRLHDHSITDALNDFLAHYDERKIVAIMGGHSILRSNKSFLEVARISKQLTEMGYLMLSGGGPGAMEATHVGAWFGGRNDEELTEAWQILSQAPEYSHPLWLDKAYDVLLKYPTSPYESIGIPTWFYGHEPATPFATRIAKYFENSIREEGLLAVAKGGVIFTPGNAGTIQEIFQEANQNHYLTFEISSPMVFYNVEYWTQNRPIYPLLKKMSDEEKYKNLILSVCDTQDEVIAEIVKFTEYATE